MMEPQQHGNHHHHTASSESEVRGAGEEIQRGRAEEKEQRPRTRLTLVE
jgi:hypothetical protein